MSEKTTLDDLILGFSAGRLPEAVRFLMASHIELCPKSASLVGVCDAVGGQFMERLPEASIDDAIWSSILEKINDETDEIENCRSSFSDSDLPTTLRSALGCPIDALPWREFSGIGEYDVVPQDDEGYTIKLLRVRAGRGVPQHTHDGDELTLVLRGAFDDITGRYERGDVAVADATVDHKPVADMREDCLCLAVTNAPIRLSGTFTQFINPFLKF